MDVFKKNTCRIKYWKKVPGPYFFFFLSKVTLEQLVSSYLRVDSSLTVLPLRVNFDRWVWQAVTFESVLNVEPPHDVTGPEVAVLSKVLKSDSSQKPTRGLCNVGRDWWVIGCTLYRAKGWSTVFVFNPLSVSISVYTHVQAKTCLLKALEVPLSDTRWQPKPVWGLTGFCLLFFLSHSISCFVSLPIQYYTKLNFRCQILLYGCQWKTLFPVCPYLPNLDFCGELLSSVTFITWELVAVVWGTANN